ncbi:monosaccharide ABC transporter ATP-binding protein (CUT2 family) [Roseibium hamelinense]|uniref:Monosaccharide ABC transporter ATP-binding protein (CUT2 family) n=1 Tax=Roseibium hamelinense TaxID=150831 RepID=A0A562TIH6_9HYPH|nr:sugar ABC transporter ATP-binding protein [Roseibium hamelinense]MTI45636.1 sugar ABC transporter ATP-binding protein [Roseibium hamelinense]TWI93183.1 monosaccharide ABC transporter ATP-binding protein (CUT2 family) [Roseibium hamelinense]
MAAADFDAAPATPSPQQAFLAVEGLKKHFGGVKALDSVSFSLKQGEVHALVGENGAGKSTLIKILSGVFAYDAGQIHLDGAAYQPASPHDAKISGVQVVHQEFNLLDHLSIAENISIEKLPRTRLGLLDKKELNRRAVTALEAIGLTDIDVRAPIASLGIAHRQLVEIARALQSRSRILILDEPTATLTKRETERLFEIVESIKADGVTVVFVSHHLDEVFRICDRVTVFRNGKTIATDLISDTSPEGVVHRMVGRRLEAQIAEGHETLSLGPVALGVQDLRTAANPKPTGVTFDLHYGEIVGIAGLVGAGRTEILRGIFGMDPIQSGRILRDEKEVRFKGPGDAIASGLGFVTEDRKGEGLVLDMPIAANSSMANIASVSNLGLIKFAEENRQARDAGAKLKLKYGDTADPASSLSGGNQQKVVLAKWLVRNPKVLLLDEPTRGVDVGAKAEIYAILKGLAREGVALLVVSSEMPELMTLSDRILVLSDHEIQGELKRPEFSEENILKLAYGRSEQAGGLTQ